MKKTGKHIFRQAVGLTLEVAFIGHIVDVVQKQGFMTMLVLH